ncbi:MAG: nucleotidyltransferase family protein [Bacteroidetes bacterium]|nr:nucleotidyltransferase family protein [Bacteroidota bacterium]
MIRSLSPEQQFLLHCCRSKLNQLSPGDVRVGLGLSVDWETFIDLTTWHRLFPQARRVLGNHAELVPPGIMEEITRHSSKSLKRMLNLAGELNSVDELFAAHHINFICLKGPLMVSQLYGDYSCRQTRDLDILVEEKDIDRAISQLTGAGFILADPYFCKNPEKRPLYLKRENHVRLRHPDKMIFTELHWSVSKYFTTIETADLFKNAVTIEIQGKRVKTFSAEDYFVILAVHGIYHQYDQLFWLYDMAHIMRMPDVSLHNLLTAGKKFNCMTAVKVTIALVSSVFNVLSHTGDDDLTRLSRHEKFLFDQCMDAIFHRGEDQHKGRIRKIADAFGRRISRQKYLLLMTNDWKSKKRVLINILIKPYVWEDTETIPRNNLIYLVMTQIKWLNILLSGRMNKRGRIRKG